MGDAAEVFSVFFFLMGGINELGWKVSNDFMCADVAMRSQRQHTEIQTVFFFCWPADTVVGLFDIHDAFPILSISMLREQHPSLNLKKKKKLTGMRLSG